MFYSVSTGGFYDSAIHGSAMPVDSVEITEEEHLALLEGQSTGKLIRPDVNGRPELQDPPPPTLDEVKAVQIAQIDAAYADAIQQPVQYMGTVFQADFDSQDTMTKVLAPGVLPPGFFWLDTNNERVPMTLDDLRGLAGVVLMQGQAAFSTRIALKAAVRAAQDVDDVHAVAWPK